MSTTDGNVVTKSVLRGQFFELLFQDYEGILCLATTQPQYPKATFRQQFFEWPNDFEKIERFISSHEEDHNVYFCVNLLSQRERKKEFCLATDLLWADLDEVEPDKVNPPPSVVIRSSKGRYQSVWRLTTKLDPYQAEEYSRRLAYSVGADKSGWDLTQLFRVPFTYNFKYTPAQQIDIPIALDVKAKPLIFEALPEPAQVSNVASIQREKGDIPPPEAVIYKYTASLGGTGFSALYTEDPGEDGDWSRVLWRLIHVCFEAGMEAEEVFSVVASANCNKYYRDGRPSDHLWRDVLKAEEGQKKIIGITGGFQHLTMPKLVEEPTSETFIDKYRDWAAEATDAVPQFHDLCCAILLSSIVANSIRLETSYGLVVPNLWGLILGDSTLTRKTTAMRMATDMLMALDPSLVLATDGSAEGLLTGLSERPNKVSVYFKDEVSGFFDSINRKDYLAGMPETLTGLYDVPAVFTRRLRKETIRIESPAFIFFGGGVRERVYDALTEEYVLSGFLPRFLVVAGETDLSKLRRTGPANELGTAKRSKLMTLLADMYEQYAADVMTEWFGQKIMMPPRIMAHLTDEAWEEYGRIEELMVNTASASSVSMLALPTFERLSRSMLKLAVILGSTRQTPTDEKITITVEDITNAAWYVQDWGRYSIELALNSGRKTSEKLLEKVVTQIRRHPGILRSQISQSFHLSKRELDDVLSTLEDRNLIRKEQQGRGYRYYITSAAA